MLRQDGDGVLLDILVQPRASRSKVGPVHGDRLKVAVTAPPVDGQANRALLQVLSKALGRKRHELELTNGHGSRRKTVRICGADVDDIRSLIATS